MNMEMNKFAFSSLHHVHVSGEINLLGDSHNIMTTMMMMLQPRKLQNINYASLYNIKYAAIYYNIA